MAAINFPDVSCTVANPSNATAQLSLKALAWRALSPSSVAGVAAVADKPVYALRMHLLALVDRNGLDESLVRRLHDLDIAACTGLDDAQLVTFLHMLDDTATRWAGKVPTGHTAAIHCHCCGTVYVHPGMAAVLPVVNDWPRALGCPWCAIRNVGEYVPRPPVQCDGCQHYRPDAINPEADMGTCASDHDTHYPMQRHSCSGFNPNKVPTA